MRVLITGSRGQIGSCLKDRIPDTWELIATDSKTLDITNAEKVEQMVSSFQPDVIVNTAAYSNIDGAETEQEKAFLINATGSLNLAQIANKFGSKFINLSTNYVFDGLKSTPYSEEDAPNPISVYGKSKLAGETLTLAANPNSLIIRTSAIYSEYGINFVKEILKLAKEQASINIDIDLITCPTYAGDLAQAIIDGIRFKLDLRGIIHFSSNKIISLFDFAREVLDLAGYNEIDLIPTYARQQGIIRPKYGVLKNSNPEIVLNSLKDVINKIQAPS